MLGLSNFIFIQFFHTTLTASTILCYHLLKQRSRKSLPSGERTSGIGGGPLEEAMWNMADTCTVPASSAFMAKSISSC